MQSRRKKDNEQWNIKTVSYFLNAIVVQVFGFIQRENGPHSRKWKMAQKKKNKPNNYSWTNLHGTY